MDFSRSRAGMCALWIAAFHLAQPLAKADEPAASRIAILIEQLGHRDYRARDAASRDLEALGETAVLALEKARDASDDAEVRRRATMLLDHAEGLRRQRLARQLHGAWTVTSAERGGRPHDELLRGKLTFSPDGEILFQRAGAPESGSCGYRYGLQPTHTPGHLCVFRLREPGDDVDDAMLGIYTLHGDELRICFGEEGGKRPSEFKTYSGTGELYLVLRRAAEPVALRAARDARRTAFHLSGALPAASFAHELLPFEQRFTIFACIW
jgi:uncharacterized protein (TIGR03067 family)